MAVSTHAEAQVNLLCLPVIAQEAKAWPAVRTPLRLTKTTAKLEDPHI